MANDSSNHHHKQEPALSSEQQAATILAFVVFGLLVLGNYLAVTAFHIRPSQLVELGLYVLAFLAASAIVIWYFQTRRRRIEDRKTHPPIFVPMLKDREYVQKACEKNSIVLGYDVYAKPLYWSDDTRRMQTIVVGQSGSGKTTLLHNVITQDIHRLVGPPDDRHHIPLIIFDGKGDQAFFNDLLWEVAAAGRMHQLRVLNPSQPDSSVRFNPLYSKDGSYQELVNAFFESFALKQDFFYGHQANYFSDVVRVLHHTGKLYNIYDVLVMARDSEVLKEQVDLARADLAGQSGIGEQSRLNFEMSVKNLLQSLEDRERIPKIQGLVNELMIFLEDDLSIITGAYEELLTFDEVIDEELILFVSLNTNKNAKAITALGRMLLQNLQLMVGKRYETEPDRISSGQPMVSVVLDEFAPFAYPNFSQILQTARGSNIAFLFSLQSIPQLQGVSRGFQADVSAAPGTIMALRNRDEETVKYVVNAAGSVDGERRTLAIERTGLFDHDYRKLDRGSVTLLSTPRVDGSRIKNFPVGQMQVLMTDQRLGTLCSHLHVRRPLHQNLASFEPTLYYRPRQVNTLTKGANLRFKDPEAARQFTRIMGRNRVA